MEERREGGILLSHARVKMLLKYSMMSDHCHPRTGRVLLARSSGDYKEIKPKTNIVTGKLQNIQCLSLGLDTLDILIKWLKWLSHLC